MTDDFNFLVYKSIDEDVSVNALVKDDTIWLPQKAMAEAEYDGFNAIQKITSDFDRAAKKMLKGGGNNEQA